MRRLEMMQVDVFTERPWPAIRWPSSRCRGLSDAQMQAIAREMNLTETTFVSPPEAAATHACASSRRPRSCPSPAIPSVGTACTLVRWGIVPAVEPVTRVVLELGVGPTVVEVEVRDGEPRGRGPPGPADLRQSDPEGRRGGRARPAPESDLRRIVEPRVVATGLAYAIIPLRDRGRTSRLARRSSLLPAFESVRGGLPYGPSRARTIRDGIALLPPNSGIPEARPPEAPPARWPPTSPARACWRRVSPVLVLAQGGLHGPAEPSAPLGERCRGPAGGDVVVGGGGVPSWRVI